MRFLPTTLALLFAFAASLEAGDLPTVRVPLPDINIAQGATISPIDLRTYFETADIHGQVVQFRSSLGIFNVEMLPAAAPLSVANFLNYANGARYANTFIHRSDVGLGVIQGGGYALATFSHIPTDPPVALEYNLPNVRGTISMARTAALNSGTSEWFINTDDNTTQLGQANGGGYAVFGRVTGTGMAVVDAIAALPVWPFNSPFGQLPLQGYSGIGQPPNSTFVAINAASAVPIFPASAGQNAVVTFSVANTNPSLVTPTVSGSSLSVAITPGAFGIADVTVLATDSNGNAALDTFRVNVAAVPADIAVEQPGSTVIAPGGTKSIATVLGTPANFVFTIKNPGTAILSGLAVTVDGANAADFTVTASPAASVIPGGSTTFTLRFAPATGGAKTAALHIANNVTAKNPFNISLAGNALTFAVDGDADGLSDASEFLMSPLGFDWQVSQSALVANYNANANGAGLYTTTQIQALNVGTPLIQRNAATGVFKLTIGVKKSTSPGLPFTDFPMNAAGASTAINGQGKLEFQFTVPDNAAFFRLESQ